MTEEIWRDIKGYEGIYQVSSMGRVRGFYFGKEKMLKPRKDRDGYLLINLHRDGKQYTFRVHRLVAEAFIPNPENKPCIDHINTIKDDNRIENLRWVSIAENNQNPLSRKNLSKGKTGKHRGKEHHNSIPVIQYSKSNKIIGFWENCQEAARYFGLYSGSNIGSCCRGLLKSSNGFKWRYLNDQLADWLEEIQDEDMTKERVA